MSDFYNVSYREFLQLEEEEYLYHKRAGLNMKGNPSGLPSVLDWGYGKVKELHIMYEEAMTMERIPVLLAFVYDEHVEAYWQMKWYEVFKMFNHITKEMKLISEKEKVLSYEPDGDQLAAGVERLGKFGIFATVDTLADGDPTRYPEIENIPYKIIFSKLYYDREKAEYIKNLQGIKSKKR